MIKKRLRDLRRYCLNFQDIENYEEAVASPEQYYLHHRKGIETQDDGTVVRRSRKELKEMNLYYHRPAEDLIFIKSSDHTKIHHKGEKRSAETRAKMSAAKKGKFRDDKSPHWKGDLASDRSKYRRVLRQKKRAATSFCHLAVV